MVWESIFYKKHETIFSQYSYNLKTKKNLITINGHLFKMRNFYHEVKPSSTYKIIDINV